MRRLLVSGVLGLLGVRPSSSAMLPHKVTAALGGMQRGQIRAKHALTEAIFGQAGFPAEFPYTAEHFARQDESTDTAFYSQPRLQYHIDDAAVASLTEYYTTAFPPKADVLDLCSSWVSHFPPADRWDPGQRTGLGMNAAELQMNPQLDVTTARDLNVEPALPYDDASFDVVTIVVSVDYLTRPLEVFREIHRVLRPGGLAIISQSNRCFPTKAISIWLNTNDYEHCWIIGSYFNFAGGFTGLQVEDIGSSPNTDPMFIVSAVKARSTADAAEPTLKSEL